MKEIVLKIIIFKLRPRLNVVFVVNSFSSLKSGNSDDREDLSRHFPTKREIFFIPKSASYSEDIYYDGLNHGGHVLCCNPIHCSTTVQHLWSYMRGEELHLTEHW